jgi:hypothetical protein
MYFDYLFDHLPFYSIILPEFSPISWFLEKHNEYLTYHDLSIFAVPILLTLKLTPTHMPDSGRSAAW